MIRPATDDLRRIGMQLFVARTTGCGKHVRHGMRRFEIVGIDDLPGLAEFGELLLADFDLLVFFGGDNGFVIRHDAFVDRRSRRKNN